MDRAFAVEKIIDSRHVRVGRYQGNVGDRTKKTRLKILQKLALFKAASTINLSMGVCDQDTSRRWGKALRRQKSIGRYYSRCDSRRESAAP